MNKQTHRLVLSSCAAFLCAMLSGGLSVLAQGEENMLKASIIRTADSQRIDYTFTNIFETPVYLASYLYTADITGKTTLRPGLCYVTAGEKEGVVAGKYIFELPEPIKVEAPEVPFFVRLEPGQSHQGFCETGRPTPIYKPYRENDYAAGDITDFKVSYIRADRLNGYVEPWKSQFESRDDLYMADQGSGFMNQVFAEISFKE